MRFRCPTSVFLILIGLFVGLGALALEKFEGFARLKNALQTTSVGSGMMDYGTLGSILKQLHLVAPEPTDYERFPAVQHSDEELETLVFQKKRRVEEYAYGATTAHERAFRSSAVIHNLRPDSSQWPIISIVVDDDFLHDPDTGIMVNREQKGGEWERIAEVSYAEQGKVLFETHAGIRMHGGKRLTTGEFTPGFRLYFRRKYGLEQVPTGLILPDLPVPLRTVVLQTSAWPPGYPLNNPIAYDIARQIGCEAPETRLISIYLNGKPYSLGFATEHLSRRQWGQRLDGEDYFFVKYRSKNSDRDLVSYREKLGTALDEGVVLNMQQVAERIDLDNLTAQILAWGFCGTGDYCQGVAVGRRDDPASRLFYLTWDMDHSFWDGSARTYGFDRRHWQQPALEGFLEDKDKRRICWRTYIFNRLFYHDPAYRNHFLQRLNETLNHRVSPSFLRERLDYYRHMLATSGQPHADYLDMLSSFFENRASFIYAELHDLFSIPPPSSCSISFPEGLSVRVDGYEYRDPYQGFYYPSSTVSVTLPDSFPDSLRAVWLVNGAQVEQPRLQLRLDGNTAIELLVAPASTPESPASKQ